MREQLVIKNLKKINNPGVQLFQARILWDDYSKNFNDIADPGLYTAIQDLLLQRTFPMNENDMTKYIDESDREKRIESITIRLMGTPEYQLC
jgi:hypothetical protein